MCKMLVGAVAVALGMPGPAYAEHVTLQTPAAWTVTTLDAPETDGHPVKGARHRAMLPGPNGRPLAAIEVTELGRVPTRGVAALAAAALSRAGCRSQAATADRLMVGSSLTGASVSRLM